MAVGLFFGSSSAVSDPGLEVTDDPNTYILLLPHTRVLTDIDNQLTLQEVVSQLSSDQFKTLAVNENRFYRESGSYWFSFSLSNTSDKSLNLWLECDNTRLDNIELYTQTAATTDAPYTLLDRAGDKNVKPQWDIQERINLLRLSVPANTTQKFLFKVENTSGVRFSARLYSDHSQTIYFGSMDKQLGIIYGILLALFIYTLNVYIALKDRTFLYFMVVLVAVTLQTATSQGTIKVLFPGSSQLVDFLTIFGSSMNIIASAFFIRNFLMLAKHNPLLDKILLATAIMALAVFPIYPWSLSATEITTILAGSIATLITILACAIRLHNGYTPAAFPLAGSLFIFIPMLVVAIIPESSVPTMTTSNLLNLCVVFKMIAWASGMTSSIDNINKQLTMEVDDRKRRERQLTQAQSIARYGDWSWDTETNEFSFSESAEKILPPIPKTSGNNFDQLLQLATPEEKEQLRQSFGSGQDLEEGFQSEFKLQHPDGSTRYYLTEADFHRDRRGVKTSLMIGTLHDITEKKLADLAYRENEQRWRDLADSTFEAILIFQDCLIIDANQACSPILCASPSELIGSSGESFMDKNDLPDLLQHISNANNEAVEFSLPGDKDTTITVEIRSKNGTFNQQSVQIVAIRDISERTKYEQKLRQLGYYDSLTGLANRTLFQERLQHAINKSNRTHEKHALLFIDLDQFKNINDSLGHDVGDQLLVEVGKRLKSRARKMDTVARLGGDEFALLVEDISAPYSAAKVADELIKLMSEHITVDDYKLLVTPSIGIALFPSDGNSSGELLRKADTAMYHAKSKGRNNYQFYTEQLNEKIVRRMDLESELRVALDKQELFLNYQPKVNLQTGEIVGAEALLRWDSGKYGMISPAEFVPIAEETGIIWQITEFVLEQACQQAAEWIEAHPSFQSMAVNISGVQFNHSDLVETIGAVLTSSKIPPENLELEITEGAIIDNAEEAINAMQRLKTLGVKLSLDDFGTGYSSLSYLKRFPVDSLKIDRSFVAEIVSDKTDLKIAGNIVKLAHDLSLNVVAEGVETDEQLKLIKALGCDELQGYIFSRPLSKSDFSAMFTQNKSLYS
ncbi:hypothetical protein BST96_11425 [Oceanicoccus sagamiensis]|uniref:cyclic-guanylate-specific phosphodiesterase n=2 Tax=Oceanicoccus sagamiensis TaxID=716816 RepID=A0A1X9NFM1_9GAMM|nr:hypothetical protein BST96_11425 [Oceanicoccus sagamiensis]